MKKKTTKKLLKPKAKSKSPKLYRPTNAAKQFARKLKSIHPFPARMAPEIAFDALAEIGSPSPRRKPMKKKITQPKSTRRRAKKLATQKTARPRKSFPQLLQAARQTKAYHQEGRALAKPQPQPATPPPRPKFYAAGQGFPLFAKVKFK